MFDPVHGQIRRFDHFFKVVAVIGIKRNAHRSADLTDLI